MSLAYPLLLLLLQSGAGIHAGDTARDQTDCSDPTTQQAMNYCASRDFRAADAALNRQWQDTAARMRRLDANIASDDARPTYFAQLLEAQRAWLRFRDGHCASVGYQARGGSLEPLLIATCRAELTRERTRQLEELEDFPN